MNGPHDFIPPPNTMISNEVFDALERYEKAHRAYAEDYNAQCNPRSLTKNGNALIDAEGELLTAFRRWKFRASDAG